MGWVQIDANGTGYANDWAWDGDNDGRGEQFWLNNDYDGDYDVVLYDSNEDGNFEWINMTVDGDSYREGWIYNGAYRHAYLDANHDGAYEIQAYDQERDGYYEWVKLDTDGNGHADRWVQNSQVPAYQDAGSVAARQFVQYQANVAAVGVMFAANSTFRF